MSKRNLFAATGKIDGDLPKIDTIIHVYNNYMLKLEGGVLKLSSDYGQTWGRTLNYLTKLTEIRFTHIFSNGGVLLGDNTKLAYSNVDFSVFEYSDIRNVAGGVFVPTLLYDNFTTVNGTIPQKDSDGKEFFMWGNYNNNENTGQSGGGYSYIWWTENYGQTVKCIYDFKLSTLSNGQSVVCRHIHNVYYYQADNAFIINTGDEPRETQSHWIKVAYNKANPNPFTFTLIGSGDKYKSVNVMIQDGYVYASLDIAGGGLIRIPYNQMSDVTKFENIFVGINDAIFIWVKGKEVLLIQSRFFGEIDGRYFYYSPNFENTAFSNIMANFPLTYNGRSILSRVFAPNDKGMILSGTQLDFQQPWSDNTYIPSSWIDQALKNAGFPNAFKSL